MKEPVADRRLAAVSFSVQLLADLITEGHTRHYRVVSGLRPDADYCYAMVDNNRGVVGLVFSHPSFPPLAEGAQIPELEVTFESVRA